MSEKVESSERTERTVPEINEPSTAFKREVET